MVATLYNTLSAAWYFAMSVQL